MNTWCGAFFMCLKEDKKNQSIDLSMIKTIICRKIRFWGYCTDTRAGSGLSRTRTHTPHLLFAQELLGFRRSQSPVYQMLPSRLFAEGQRRRKLLCLHSLPPKLGNTCSRGSVGSVSEPPLPNHQSDSWLRDSRRVTVRCFLAVSGVCFLSTLLTLHFILFYFFFSFLKLNKATFLWTFLSFL